MEFSLLQEEIFQKQLWDISAYTNSIACCEEIGTVATMTKLAIHLHTPQFKYMSAYHVRWLLIDKKAPQFIEPPESVTDNVTSLTNFLVEHGMRENNVSFRSIQWSKGIVSNHNYAPLLLVLLTDGTALFVDTCSKNVVQTTFGVDYVPTAGSDQTHTLSYLDESTYSIKLRECSVSLDCAAAYKQYCQGAGLNVFKYRIRCITEHHVAGSGAHLVCFGTCDRVTVWQVYYNAAGGLQISLLAECLLPECAVDFTVTSVLFVALATTPTVSTVAVVCGTNDGEVVTFELKLTQNAVSSVLVGPVYSASQVTSRLAGRVNVSDAPIDRLKLSNDNNTTVTVFVGAEMHSVSIATLLNPANTSTNSTLTTMTRLYPYGSVSAFETLPDLRTLTSTTSTGSTSINTNTTVSRGILTTSTAGLLSTWSTTTTNSTPTLTLEQNILNKAKGYPIVGLATDPTRLVYTYLYKTPAMHSNSREVQLNIALRNPRSAIATSVSPFVVQDFAASVLSTARVLLYVLHAQHTNTTRAVKVPLSGLVLAYLHSLETDPCKQHYRTQIANLPHDDLTSSITATDKSKRKRTANSSANSSDSESASENESDSEPENTPSKPKQTIFLHKDQQLQKLQQQALANKSVNSDSDSDASQLRSGAKSSGGPKGKKFLASQTRVRNTAKLYDRIEQLARPGNMEVVTLAVGTVFDAAVCVAYALSNNNHHSHNNSRNNCSSGVSSRTSGNNNTVSVEMLTAVDENVCAVVKDMDLGDKIEVLFALPTEDTHILDLKRTLWQSLHVILLASHRVRCVSRIGADWEDVPDSLRQIMHSSYCYQALSRWLATTDASAVNTDFQSVYFMSRVLGTESAAPEGKALALAVQLQLLAYTSHESSRNSSRTSIHNSSDISDSAVLHSMYGAEECGICGRLVDFQPTHDQIIETESAKQKTGPENTVCGSSVLYGTCQGCSVRTERCCFSLRLLTTPPSNCVASPTSNNSSRSGCYGSSSSSSASASASRVLGQDSRVYACPVCTAATSVCLVRTVTAPNSVLRGTAPQALLCPYCAVLMQPL